MHFLYFSTYLINLSILSATFTSISNMQPFDVDGMYDDDFGGPQRDFY